MASASLISVFSPKGKLLKQELFNFNNEHAEDDEYFEYSDWHFLNDSIIEIQFKSIPADSSGIPPIASEKNIEYRYIILREGDFYSPAQTYPGPNDPPESRFGFRIYSEEYFKKMDKKTLRIYRNSIFALHGYRFKSPDLQRYFASKSWYKPENKSLDEIVKTLNPVEKINIQLLKLVEISKP